MSAVLVLIGLVTVSVGAGLYHPGAGLIVFGIGTIVIALLIAQTPDPEPVQPGRFDALRTASPPREEDA